MGKHLYAAAAWPTLLGRLRSLVPEAFDASGRVLNLTEGRWQKPGRGKPILSPCDGTALGQLPMLDPAAAQAAVRHAAAEARAWAPVDLDTRRERISGLLAQLKEHRELLAHLLAWEIGKPVRQALTSVDRCVSGVAWYVEHAERMLAGRAPLGVVSNIASWNYPLSVLVHAALVQALCGNAVVAKTPSDGGLYSLTLAFALAKRAGLPVTLLSGSGGALSEALVRNPDVDCLAFVGGKANGRQIAASLYDRDKRYMLEMEGVNAFGVWRFSDWAGLAAQLRKGFEYGKQRCTAYPRWVIQRDLVPRFLEAYLPVLASLQVGHPLLEERPGGPPQAVDFGPLINSHKVEELHGLVVEAQAKGAVALYRGQLDPERLLPEQDASAYLAPVALLNVPHNCGLYHAEPFGPVDTLVVVDTEEELVAEMNVSNGSLVASLACDEPATAARVAGQLRAFKVGHNQPRSRGDREELFGGIGESWRGCFVGGELLVRAVTRGPAGEPLYGNFHDHVRLPETR